MSFTAGTKVLLAGGRAVPIPSLVPGEKVLATNTRTGKTQAEPIAAVLVHHDTNLYDLTVRAGGRVAVIDTTSNYPFWDATTRRWVKAAALRYGTHLRTPNGATAVALGGHRPSDPSGWMWDLTIPGDHDFYVVVAASAILVHNTSCRTFGYLSPSGRMDLPNTPGVYKITTEEDGETYIGKASDIHQRIHAAFLSGGALHDLGYNADQVRSLDWMEMPGATDSELFDMEKEWTRCEGGSDLPGEPVVLYRETRFRR
jgi:hypothetical protein